VGGGSHNFARGGNATVAGGLSNSAGGNGGAVPGGYMNRASGDYSFAAGRRAKALHDGAFVWADRTDSDFESTVEDQFRVRTTGGFEVVVDDDPNSNGSFRIEPASDPNEGPNLIAGSVANGVAPGVFGSTIAGGGSSVPYRPNRVYDDYGVVGGGKANQAGDPNASSAYATVAGGMWNLATGEWSAIGGGDNNIASGTNAAIGGGGGNKAEAYCATVPGGLDNQAGGECSFAAGRRAQADHNGAFVWGDNTNADVASESDNQFLVRATGGVALRVDADGGGLRIDPDPNTPNVIGGSGANIVAGGVSGATIAGGGSTSYNWYNRVYDDYGFVGGGIANQAGDPLEFSAYATVAGGLFNFATGDWSMIGGGDNNTAAGTNASIGGGGGNTAEGYGATVPGGVDNQADGDHSFAAGRRAKALHDGAFVWADSADMDFESTIEDQFRIRAAGGLNVVVDQDPNSNGSFRIEPTVLPGAAPNVIVGHPHNRVADGLYGATISGGGSSGDEGYNCVYDDYGVVGGGSHNQAGDPNRDSRLATVSGGAYNFATGFESMIGGGGSNIASGSYASIAGGSGNTAEGRYAVVPGGFCNQAGGHYSFAAGRKARVRQADQVGGGDTDGDEGAFVWADSADYYFYSFGPNEFAVRCSGGARFVSAIDGAGNPTAGVQLASGGGSWSSISDRNRKDNFVDVDGVQVLKQLVSVPIAIWNYKSQDPAIRHMGPVAQDFHAAFGLGEDDKHITTIDADGVALAAIQGLYEIVQAKDAEIAAQHKQIADLTARLAAVEELLAKRTDSAKEGVQ
jgi:hypothetical protein